MYYISICICKVDLESYLKCNKTANMYSCDYGKTYELQLRNHVVHSPDTSYASNHHILKYIQITSNKNYWNLFTKVTIVVKFLHERFRFFSGYSKTIQFSQITIFCSGTNIANPTLAKTVKRRRAMNWWASGPTQFIHFGPSMAKKCDKISGKKTPSTTKENG